MAELEDAPGSDPGGMRVPWEFDSPFAHEEDIMLLLRQRGREALSRPSRSGEPETAYGSIRRVNQAGSWASLLTNARVVPWCSSHLLSSEETK